VTVDCVCCSESEVKGSLVKIYLLLGLTMAVFTGGTYKALNAGSLWVRTNTCTALMGLITI